MRHGRLHWFTPDELSPGQRDIYDRVLAKYGPEPPFPLTDGRGRLHGPFNAMVAAPGVGGALQALSSALGSRTSLPARTREIVILAVAAARDSAFERSAHRLAGAAAGVDPTEIAALESLATPDSITGADRAALDLARALLADHDVPDPVYAAAEEHFAEHGVVELVTLVGYYELVATLLRTLRVPLPDGG